MNEGSLLDRLRKRFSKGKPIKVNKPDFFTWYNGRNMDWDFQGEASTQGGKMFREWLKKRIVSEEIKSDELKAAQVSAPTDPKEIERRKALNRTTSDMMKTNKQLVPGKTDQQVVANAVVSDPKVSKLDTDTQKSVSDFFIKPKDDQ